MSKFRRNNYERAAEGQPNIECVCMYDTDISSMYFKDNFEIIQHGDYRKTTVAYYIDNGNVTGAKDIKFLVKGTKEAKIKYLEAITSFDVSEIETWDNETMDTEILGNEEDVNLINYALDRLPDVEGLEFIPSQNLIAISTKGYCQGDYAVVLYSPDDLEKAWGRMPEQKEIQKIVDNLFWDTPIYARFEIDGKEYYYHDMPEYNEYSWDRNAFLEYVSKESGIDKEKLSCFVPEYPEYY